jgi:hypothetical protein
MSIVIENYSKLIAKDKFIDIGIFDSSYNELYFLSILV